MLFDYPVSILGDISSVSGVEVQRTFSLEGNFYKKIFVKDGFIKGAVLINATQEKDQLIQTIKEKALVVSAEAARNVI